MVPWVHLDTVAVPGEQDALRLMQRGDEFSIRIGTIELMNNRLRGSEEALATLTCARLHDRPRARVLIGGEPVTYFQPSCSCRRTFTFRAAVTDFGRSFIATSEPMTAM